MKHAKLFLSMILLGLFLLVPVKQVQAYAKIEQASQTQTSITIKWTDPNADSSSYTTTGYELRYQPYADDTKLLESQAPVKLPASATSYTITGLKPGTKYRVRLSYSYSSKYGSYNSTVSGGYDLFTAPGKVTGVNQKRWWHWALAVDFTWDKQDACQYEWKVTTHKGKAFAQGTSTYSNSASASKISNSMTYIAQVRAFVKNPTTGAVIYGDWSDKAYLFGQPMLTEKSCKVSGKKMTVKWGKIDGMTKYKVYVSTKKDSGYKAAKTLKKSKKSVTFNKKAGKIKIKKNKTYYVYVQGIKKVGSRTYTSGVNYVWQIKKKKCKLLYINNN